MRQMSDSALSCFNAESLASANLPHGVTIHVSALRGGNLDRVLAKPKELAQEGRPVNHHPPMKQVEEKEETE